MQKRTLGRKAASVYTCIVLSLLLCMGFVCCVVSHLITEAKAVEGDWFEGLSDSVWLWISFQVLPFSKSLGEAAMPFNDADVAKMIPWIPYVAGCSMIGTAVLGLRSLVFKGRWALLMYGILAPASMAMKADLLASLQKIADMEDMSPARSLSRQNRSESMEFALFQMPYRAWSKYYDEQKCTAAKPKSHEELPHVRCKSGLEGQLIEGVIRDFCHAHVPADKKTAKIWKQRVDSCRVQGREFGILPASVGRPRDLVFCHCRVVLYDVVRALAELFSYMWCAEIFAIGFVAYFGVEGNLDSMDPTSRFEVINFALFAVGLLISRTIFFKKYFEELEHNLREI